MPAVFVIGIYDIKDYAVEKYHDGKSKIITMAVVALIVFSLFPSILYYGVIIAGLIKETKYYFTEIEQKIKSKFGSNGDDDDDL